MSLLAMCQPNILYGGPAGGRTRVRNAFALKGLQQFLSLNFYRASPLTNKWLLHQQHL